MILASQTHVYKSKKIVLYEVEQAAWHSLVGFLFQWPKYSTGGLTDYTQSQVFDLKP